MGLATPSWSRATRRDSGASRRTARGVACSRTRPTLRGAEGAPEGLGMGRGTNVPGRHHVPRDGPGLRDLHGDGSATVHSGGAWRRGAAGGEDSGVHRDAEDAEGPPAGARAIWRGRAAQGAQPNADGSTCVVRSDVQTRLCGRSRDGPGNPTDRRGQATPLGSTGTGKRGRMGTELLPGVPCGPRGQGQALEGTGTTAASTAVGCGAGPPATPTAGRDTTGGSSTSIGGAV